jgi:hypothetical protein
MYGLGVGWNVMRGKEAAAPGGVRRGVFSDSEAFFRRRRSRGGDGTLGARALAVATPAPSSSTPMEPVPIPISEDLSSARLAPSASDSDTVILRYAETLRIPWKQLLVDEIEAEQRLRRYLADIESECPLRSVMRLLPSSFLRSWRARAQIERLSGEARATSTRKATRQLRAVFSKLLGKDEGEKTAFAEHLWYAYQRILLLQRVRRAAAKSRGPASERLALICSRTRCSYDDAAWALLEEESTHRGDRFDGAVRKVREEGFLVPRADTEASALAELRRLVRASSRRPRRRISRRPIEGSHCLPPRVALPVEAT